MSTRTRRALGGAQMGRGLGLFCFPNVDPPPSSSRSLFCFRRHRRCLQLPHHFTTWRRSAPTHYPLLTHTTRRSILSPSIIASNSTTSQQRLNWQSCHHHHQDSPTRLLVQTPRQLPLLRTRFTTVSSSHSPPVLLDEVIPQLQVLSLQFPSSHPASAMQAQTRLYARFTRSSPPPAHVAPYFCSTRIPSIPQPEALSTQSQTR